MRNSGKGTGKGRRGLSDEDAELWEHTARSVTPAGRLKARVHPATEGLAERNGGAARPQLRHETRVVDHAPASAGLKPHPVTAAGHGARAAAKAPPIADFDRRQARRIGAGRIEIEARIDLHGMRQSEAHAALRRFIVTSHARGLRWVLVITGKGAPEGLRSEETHFRPWLGGHIGEGERGVLRRNVPRWLSEPELRAFVVSFTAAAIRHGGDGALYVHLRNPDRHRS